MMEKIVYCNLLSNTGAAISLRKCLKQEGRVRLARAEAAPAPAREIYHLGVSNYVQNNPD